QPEGAPVVSGSLRAPRHWEQFILDAAVIAGRPRWERRLRALEADLRQRRAAQKDDEARSAQLDRQLAELDALRDFALPLLDARGLSFDAVFVPGLAEKLFPQKVIEDPLLRDKERRGLAGPAAQGAPNRGAPGASITLAPQGAPNRGAPGASITLETSDERIA